MRRSFALFALICAALPLRPSAAQGRVYPTSVRANACAAADSLLPVPAKDRNERLWYFWLYGVPEVEVELPIEPFAIHQGIVQIHAALHITGDTAVAPTSLQIELKVAGRAPRPIEERQLALVGDDSVRLDLGSMTAGSESYPGTSYAVENMVAVVSFARLAPLLRARKVRAILGTTRFDLSRQYLKQLASLAAAGTCRWHLE